MAIDTPGTTNQQASVWKMEIPTSPTVGHGCPSPHTPISEHRLDPETYTSSPNSLFIYEQERSDMKSSYGTLCNSAFTKKSNTDPIHEKYDLDPCFECSQNDILLMSPLKSQVSVISPNSMQLTWSNDANWVSSGGGFGLNSGNWEGEEMKLKNAFRVDKTDYGQGPTLAALNATSEDLSLDFADIESIINKDMAGNMTSQPKPTRSLSDCSDQRIMYQNSVNASHTVVRQVSQPIVPQAVSINYPKAIGSQQNVTLVPTTVECYQGSTSNRKYLTSLHELVKTGKFEGEQVIRKKFTLPIETSSDVLLLKNIRKRKASGGIKEETVSKSSCASCDPPRSSSDLELALPETVNSDSLNQKWEEVKHDIFDEALSQKADKTIKKEEKGKGAISVEEVKVKEEMFQICHIEEEDTDDGEWNDVSDNESVSSMDSEVSNEHKGHQSLLQKHHESYFWQYNVQSKGPKGTRLCIPVKQADPHVLDDFQDPVFAPGAQVEISGIRHGGKARRGDGNDISPNPMRLHALGEELKSIGHDINDMVPASELPANVRVTTRKEKNKLASRACRLKKKANHEANKVKMFGLNEEHRNLMTVLMKVKSSIRDRLTNPNSHGGVTLEKIFQQLVSSHLKVKVAGHTTDYVNRVIDNVRNGDKKGGLDL